MKQKSKLKNSWAFAFAAASLLLATSVSQAAVVFNFVQVGPNVVMSTSGSITTPSTANDFAMDSFFFLTPSNYYFELIAPFRDSAAPVGFHTDHTLNTRPDQISGDTFGYNLSYLMWPGAVATDTLFSPNMTHTWLNATISSIGLGALTASPTVVWTADYGTDNTISFAVIPEPSVSLLSISAFGLAALRRRR
jgi:hypothetical protein